MNSSHAKRPSRISTPRPVANKMSTESPTHNTRMRKMQTHEKTFTCFPNLPPELQLVILDKALEHEDAENHVISLKRPSCGCSSENTGLIIFLYRVFGSHTHIAPKPCSNIRQANRLLYTEGAKMLYSDTTVVLTSREARENLCTPELFRNMRQVRIRDPDPCNKENVFLSSSKDFDAAANANALMFLLSAPQLETLEIDIASFSDHCSCYKETWTRDFLQSFGLTHLNVNAICTGIGSFRLTKAEQSNNFFPTGAAGSIDISDDALNKLRLTWHSVRSTWNKVISTSPQEVALWTSFTYPKPNETLSEGPERFLHLPLAIRNFKFWLRTGGNWHTQCQWHHWRLRSYLANTFGYIRDFKDRDQLRTLLISNFHTSLIHQHASPSGVLLQNWSKERLMPGEDPALNEMWTQLFAVQSRREKQEWIEFRYSQLELFVIAISYFVVFVCNWYRAGVIADRMKGTCWIQGRLCVFRELVFLALGLAFGLHHCVTFYTLCFLCAFWRRFRR